MIKSAVWARANARACANAARPGSSMSTAQSTRESPFTNSTSVVWWAAGLPPIWRRANHGPAYTPRESAKCSFFRQGAFHSEMAGFRVNCAVSTRSNALRRIRPDRKLLWRSRYTSVRRPPSGVRNPSLTWPVMSVSLTRAPCPASEGPRQL